MQLLELWKRKLPLANGNPFSVQEDIKNAALNKIWAAATGHDMRIKPQLSLLETISFISLLETGLSAIIFP